MHSWKGSEVAAGPHKQGDLQFAAGEETKHDKSCVINQ